MIESVKCPVESCEARVHRVSQMVSTATWEQEEAGGPWSLYAERAVLGPEYRVTCEAGHATTYSLDPGWGLPELPEGIRRLIHRKAVVGPELGVREQALGGVGTI